MRALAFSRSSGRLTAANARPAPTLWLSTVRGASVPQPYGGRSRLINVDLDPAQLFARGLSPTDVSDAINAQHLVLPSGTANIGERKYAVRINGSPTAVEALNDLPIRDVYLHQRLTAPELLVTVY